MLISLLIIVLSLVLFLVAIIGVKNGNTGLSVTSGVIGLILIITGCIMLVSNIKSKTTAILSPSNSYEESIEDDFYNFDYDDLID